MVQATSIRVRSAGWRVLWLTISLAVVAVVLPGALVVLTGVGASLGTTGGVGASPGITGQAAGQSGPPDTIGATQIDADDTLLQVTLEEDGSASWRVAYRIRLETENETRAFEELRTDIESNPREYIDPFAEDMRATAARAENATGREMAIRNVTIEATRKQLPQDYGVVTYRFEWTGFATVADGGSTIRGGDALGGLFLDEQTSLKVVWPDAYHLVDVQPDTGEQQGRAYVWTGPEDFLEGQPLVVLSTEGTEPPGGNGGNGDGDNSGFLSSPGTTGAILLALGAAVIGIWLYRRDRGQPGSGTGPGTGTGSGSGSGTGSGSGAGTGGVGGASSGGPPQELLSNEEQVLALLEERNGRIKQQEVAGELGWTDAKTSQVVKGMREDDQVEVFRLGRENVLSLPDEEGRGGSPDDR